MSRSWSQLPGVSPMKRLLRNDKGRSQADSAALTGLLLEEFIRTRRYVPDEASPISAADDLPLKLRRRVQDLSDSWQWRAWSSAHRIWFVTARRVSELRLDQKEYVLRMEFFDIDGAVVACADWLRRTGGRWVLYRILEPQHSRSSQPEHMEAI